MTRRALVVLAVALGLAACRPAEPPPAVQAVPDSLRQAVSGAIRDIDAMRVGLAGPIGDRPVDAETFAQVCKPVGMRAAELSKQTGWEVRQLAVKYRNPANQADTVAAEAIARFVREARRDTLWMRAERDGKPGWRYLHRIPVEQPCLACHGAAESRPAFVVAKYPDDRAFDFKAGDVRGVYSVFVAD
ncbi:MAG: DUF3365 domain-containing protein [Rhodothermales bacterium]